MTIEQDPTRNTESFKVGTDDVEHFERPGFIGIPQVTIEQGLGFSALTVWVEGSHPRKRMLEGTRTYYVADSDPNGTFTLGDEVYDVGEGDLFVIPEGSEYSYQGSMTLFEVNVPSRTTGNLRDEKLEQ